MEAIIYFKIHDHHSLIRLGNVSMLHLDKIKRKGSREQELFSKMSAKQHDSDNDSVN